MKKAFTMLELVFVIVIVGILSYFVSSSFQRNPLREAADQVVSHIRYTQHLAMIDDKFDPNVAIWFAANWQLWIQILNGSYYYEIFSDRNRLGNSDATEEAIDPLTGRRLGNSTAVVATLPTNRDVLLSEKYGITNIDFSANCKVGQGGKISFDILGRPYGNVSYDPNDPYWKFLNNDCNITMSNSDGNITITVMKETGYTYISAQNY